ncbi:PREDICTED: receptor-like protein kinase HSL1 [Nicotiana attenuata]|uniref:Receptor-like protein kinase 5 n=1 Tax=Nicotiana attenuata TaxID=49451 RepID=A0A1J6IBR8_NICAT|nr:PREDICTED: receptor-like protein kinase HSL1 [Nicotiana attenuata]OIT01868.1 receptor-like protein kinase 5 [Nicotiana attenuata]
MITGMLTGKQSVYLILLLNFIPTLVNSQSLVTTNERDILLKIKRQWGNPLSLSSWNSTSSPCDWPEIECSDDGEVRGIILQEKDITVEIPSSICDLKNLTFLNLALNFLPGKFPTFLYNCSSLEHLDLSQNYFVGPIPADINRLKKLKYLDLGGNNFTGDIPPTIGNLTELESLYLHMNLFDGTFPAEIGNLANLENLGLAFNGFSPARIPPEFEKLKKMKYFWMRQANLIGKIPESFGNFQSLEHIDLAYNNLEGEIPSGLFLLKNLTYAYLYSNQLSGLIPETNKSSNLIELDISSNNLTGKIPESFGELKQLEILNLFSNQLYGEIPESIAKIPTLKVFKVFRNKLNGSLPSEIGLHSKLQVFEVSQNLFTGNLPQHLCAGGNLFGVVAYVNNLSGEIPKSLETCSTLRTIQLYKNQFVGEIPSGVWTLVNMTSLLLNDNLFWGKLPSKVASNFTRLEIYNNKFSGEIPVGISSWTSLVVLLASNNSFSGQIPVELTSLSRLTRLELDGNSFSGEIPAKITSWKSLTILDLAKNKLSGKIPAAIGLIPDLVALDLSQNQFSGPIPPQLGVKRITSLNLSSNQLIGKIPDAFANLAFENSFLNNPNLCTSNSLPYLPNCNAKVSNSKRLSHRVLALVLVLAIAVFLFTVVSTLFLVRDYKRKKHKRDVASWKLTSFQRLDFTEANILSSLTENNMIGSGGSGKVYKICIGRLNEYIAVKRIWSDRKVDYRLEREFLAEVQILGSIRHSNIVKLLCCISSEDSKLLVYEYMVNHSLDRWLHGKKRSSLNNKAMDWPTRLEIAIGSAQGLSYMHHDCTPPILHRDVKSSNILLDSEFKAKIADFGLAKLLDKKEELHTMSAVAGSFGYIAPEYAYTTKVNEKIDIYSFGVVLLELVTGRQPNFGEEHMSLAEWAWKQHGEGNNAIDNMLDSEIKEACYLEEMKTVFRLGLICTSNLPSSRPTMKEVLQILHRCKNFRNSGGKSPDKEYDVAPLLGNNSEKYIASYKRINSNKVIDDSDDGLIISTV